nr:hypothetical protein [Tanacetum cinerariifolium]
MIRTVPRPGGENEPRARTSRVHSRREIVREFSMHFGSWRIILTEQKARVFEKIETQFDLTPHMQSELWPEIRKGIDQHLAKIYTDNKSSLKRDYWVKSLDDETYDVEAIRSQHLANISAKD